MAPQELKIYIPHGLYVVNMVSVFARSKTAYVFGDLQKSIDLEVEEKMLQRR